MYNIHHKPSSLPQLRAGGEHTLPHPQVLTACPQISPNITIFTNSTRLATFKMSAESLMIRSTGFALSGSIFRCACTYLQQRITYSRHEQILECIHQVHVSHKSSTTCTGYGIKHKFRRIHNSTGSTQVPPRQQVRFFPRRILVSEHKKRVR